MNNVAWGGDQVRPRPAIASSQPRRLDKCSPKSIGVFCNDDLTDVFCLLVIIANTILNAICIILGMPAAVAGSGAGLCWPAASLHVAKVKNK